MNNLRRSDRSVDRAGGVAEAAVEELLLDVLAVLDLNNFGLDREARWLDVDPAHVLATDLQDLLADVRCRGHADRIAEGLVQMESEQVAAVLTRFAKRGVVGAEAEDRSVVGDPDEQRSALAAVQEGGHGLEGRRLERLE